MVQRIYLSKLLLFPSSNAPPIIQYRINVISMIKYQIGLLVQVIFKSWPNPIDFGLLELSFSSFANSMLNSLIT